MKRLLSILILLLLASPGWAAFTERYVTDAGAGTADGTSLANAWSWATMLTSLTGGQRANIKGAITRTTSADTFSNAGATTGPISIRGINATDGDLEANGRTSGSSLVTTNFPVVTYTTGGVTFPNFMVIENISFTSAKVGATVTAGQSNIIRRITVANTHASSASAIAIATGTSLVIDNCDATCSSSSTSAFATSGSASGVRISRSLIVGTVSGAGCISSSGSAAITQCMIRDAGTGLSLGAQVHIEGCSFRNISGDYIKSASTFTVANCVAWGSGGSSKWVNNTSTVRINYQSHNAVGNMGGADTNVGDWPVNYAITLTADPFASSTDLTPNSTAGGGAALKAAGTFPYLDIGAIQVQASASGGGSTPVFSPGGVWAP